MKMPDKYNSTFIMGLGNPIVSDDAVGLLAAEAVYNRIRKNGYKGKLSHANLTFAGWRIIDFVGGYNTLIIFDAIETNSDEPGNWYIIDPCKIDSFHLRNSHGLGLMESLQLAGENGYSVPSEVIIFAITVENLFEFGETISVSLENKLPKIINDISELLINKNSILYQHQNFNNHKELTHGNA